MTSLEKRLEYIFMDYTQYNKGKTELTKTGRKHLERFLKKLGLELK